MIPTSCSRVAENNPNWGPLYTIYSKLPFCIVNCAILCNTWVAQRIRIMLTRQLVPFLIHINEYVERAEIPLPYPTNILKRHWFDFYRQEIRKQLYEGIALVQISNEVHAWNTNWRQPCNACEGTIETYYFWSFFRRVWHLLFSHSKALLTIKQQRLLKFLCTNMQGLVRLLAECRIKPHVPPFVWVPVNSFRF